MKIMDIPAFGPMFRFTDANVYYSLYLLADGKRLGRKKLAELVGVGERVLGQDQIIAMDYLVENVRGAILAYDALNPTGKATVDSAGVRPATKTALEVQKR